MADVLTAEQVGQVLTYIAPGYFARSAYAARFPAPERPQFNLIVTCVATSLPLVAGAHYLARQANISPSATSLDYVFLLLGLSMVVGYLFAALREPKWVRQLLGAIGITSQPEALLTTQVLKPLKDRYVTVDFKDGRKLSGVPKAGPVLPDDGIHELYFSYPAWWDNERGDSVEEDAGEAVLVWIDEIHNITISQDQTV